MTAVKLLTLNTHSLQEENYSQKLEWFVEGILRERPDLLAMQEVNQTMTAPLLDAVGLEGYLPSQSRIQVLQDNHAAQAAKRLRSAGMPCSWTWLPMKCGYGKYDEGLALFSFGKPIAETDAFYVSGCSDYKNWQTRMLLGVRLEGCGEWFYTVHMGWWGDNEEPFYEQWKSLERQIAPRKMAGPVWLLGDFNAPADVQGESYDCIRCSDWQDTYLLAAEKDDGKTVVGAIDGWKNKRRGRAGIRIDYIWSSQSRPISCSRTIFNGRETPIVSDHFGLLVETDAEGGAESL